MDLFELKQRNGFPYITGLHGLESYAAAYWQAAKKMTENKLFDGHGKPDFSTFPIAFLYRHALELMLKAILVEHHEKYCEEPELVLDPKDRGHKLPNAYLTDLQSVVAKAGLFTTGQAVIQISPEDWSHLQKVLEDWQKVDPDGMAFRYSFSLEKNKNKEKKKEKKALKNLLHHTFTFDIQSFAAGMEKALQILRDLKDELDDLSYQDAQRRAGPLQKRK